MSADPNIYPWTPDDEKAYQLCDKTLYEMSEFYGRPLDPSLFMGSCPSNKIGIHVLGFAWDKPFRLEYDVKPVRVFSRTTSMFGLANGTSSGYKINPDTLALQNFSASNKDPLGGQRGQWNARRWATGKESVTSNDYSFKPVMKLNKGACVGYLTIYAKKELPSSFESSSAYSTWKNQNFSGTLEEWNAQKETYPNIYRITIVFRAGQTIGGSRTANLYPFFEQKYGFMNGYAGGYYTGGGFSYFIPDEIPDIGGQYMGGDIIPRDSEHINYYATSRIFNGVETATSGMTELVYAGVEKFANWCGCLGYGDFRSEKTGYIDGGIYKPILWTFYDGDPNEILDDFVMMGFAMTDKGQNKAQSGDIVTDPNIFVPTYDTNGDIDGKSNTAEDGQSYIDGGTAGEPIQPNFDPYADEPEEEEEYPEENPDQDKETDQITLPDTVLTSTGIFNRSYVMTKAKMQALSDYLWNGNDTTFEKIIEDLRLVGDNCMNSIISCIMFPFELPKGEDMHLVRIGRHNTDVISYYLDDSKPLIFDMGECFFYAKYKNFLDYEPYTKAWLYIPFVGLFSIPAQQFVNHYVHVTLSIDVLTGSGQAVIYAGGIPLIYKNCTIGMQIPVTGADSTYMIKNYISAAQSFLGATVSGGSGDVAGALANTAIGTMHLLAAKNAPIESAGSSSPQCGLNMPNKCYFIIERPKTLIANVPDYGHLVGFACYKSGYVGEFSGFSKFIDIQISITNATDYEKELIIKLLSEGVYL